jgi:hypothetical protein
MDLVRGDGDRVGPQPLDVDRQEAGGLDGIDVQVRPQARGPESARDLRHRLDGAELVVH